MHMGISVIMYLENSKVFYLKIKILIWLVVDKNYNVGSIYYIGSVVNLLIYYQLNN